jgi:hypothetical protein
VYYSWIWLKAAWHFSGFQIKAAFLRMDGWDGWKMNCSFLCGLGAASLLYEHMSQPAT